MGFPRTQWFLVSDTGITTYAGTDGLNVFVRALGSAKPLADVDLQLLAKNNEVLGTAKTDADGPRRLFCRPDARHGGPGARYLDGAQRR